MRLRWVARLALGTALVIIAGCGSSTPTPNPTPSITGLFPSEITAGSQGFTLFVAGTQFLSTSTVQWNGSNRPTTFNSQSTQLAATITAADVQNAGVAQVTVTSPAPGGGSSLAIAFTINALHTGGPTITSISPSNAAVNSAAFTLTVTGTNFSPSDYVTWNGGLRPTCPMGSTCNSTQLTAQILASDLTQPMIAGIAVHTSQLGVASPSVGFQVGSATSSNLKFPQVVSVSAAGGPTNGLSSSPAMSADGRYVAFYSEAKDLVAGSGAGNIFVRDTCLGAQDCTPRTVAVDVAPGGGPPNAAAASQVAISSNGRYVAFASSATNLVPETSAADSEQRVFVRDVCLGASAPANCTPHTEFVSAESDSAELGSHPSISADGRFVAFTAPMLPPGTPSLIMVRDTCHGASGGADCESRTSIVSLRGGGMILTDPHAQPEISASGRYVVFAGRDSTSTNRNALSQIFVRDTCVGADVSCAPSTERISVAPDGQLANGPSGSPAISGDGRVVVFESTATNLGDSAGSGQQIYLRDTCTGPTAPLGCLPMTTRLTGAPADPDSSYSPSISASGRYISYVAQTENASNSSPANRKAGYLVVYDTCFGATGACSPREVELVAIGSNGDEAELTGDVGVRVPISGDGCFAAFFTRQVTPALRTSGFGDVFLTTTSIQPQ